MVWQLLHHHHQQPGFQQPKIYLVMTNDTSEFYSSAFCTMKDDSETPSKNLSCSHLSQRLEASRKFQKNPVSFTLSLVIFTSTINLSTQSRSDVSRHRLFKTHQNWRGTSPRRYRTFHKGIWEMVSTSCQVHQSSRRPKPKRKRQWEKLLRCSYDVSSSIQRTIRIEMRRSQCTYRQSHNRIHMNKFNLCGM